MRSITILYQDDQGIIVADLGGGTADLVSYRIVTVDPLQLDEICVGIGKIFIPDLRISEW